MAIGRPEVVRLRSKAKRSQRGSRLEELHQIDKAFHWIVVVCSARGESQVQIHAVRGSHGCGRSVEVDGFSFGGNGAIKDGFGQCFSQTKTASAGTDP